MTSLDLPPDLWSLSRFLASCRVSNFSEFPLALILQTCWLRQLDPAGCTQPVGVKLLRQPRRAPRQTISLWRTSEPQLNQTLRFDRCPADGYSLFWPRRGWMNSTAESEQAQRPTFSELEEKEEGKEQHLRVRGILAFFFLEKTETNPGAAAATAANLQCTRGSFQTLRNKIREYLLLIVSNVWALLLKRGFLAINVGPFQVNLELEV